MEITEQARATIDEDMAKLTQDIAKSKGFILCAIVHSGDEGYMQFFCDGNIRPEDTVSFLDGASTSIGEIHTLAGKPFADKAHELMKKVRKNRKRKLPPSEC